MRCDWCANSFWLLTCCSLVARVTANPRSVSVCEETVMPTALTLSQVKLKFVTWLVPRWRRILQWRLTTLLYERRADDLLDDALRDALLGHLCSFFHSRRRSGMSMIFSTVRCRMRYRDINLAAFTISSPP